LERTVTSSTGSTGSTDRSASLPGFVVGRRTLGEKEEACDSSFLSCLPSMGCVDCFATLELEKIDWAGVTPDTECSDVVTFLMEGGHCTKLKNDKDATRTFCNTFNACVVWSTPGGGSANGGSGSTVDPSEQEGTCKKHDGSNGDPIRYLLCTLVNWFVFYLLVLVVCRSNTQRIRQLYGIDLV
jgi:hypothetical protein